MGRRREIILGTVFFGGMIIAAGFLSSPGAFRASPAVVNSQSSPQWTQAAGEGISVPACGSASNTSPTCVNGSPSVTISWDFAYDATHATGPCSSASLKYGPPATALQEWGSYNTNAGWTSSASDQTLLARRFTASASMIAQGVGLDLPRDVEVNAGNFWITIETDSGGFPSGAAIATSNRIPYSEFCVWVCSELVDFSFPSPVLFTSGAQYWIVVRGSGISGPAKGNILIALARFNDPDVGTKSIVRSFTNPGVWSDATGYDILYRVIANSPTIINDLPCADTITIASAGGPDNGGNTFASSDSHSQEKSFAATFTPFQEIFERILSVLPLAEIRGK